MFAATTVVITYTKNTKLNLYAEPQIGIITSWMKVDKAKESIKDVSPVIGVNFRSSLLKATQLWNVIIGVNYSYNHFEGIYDNTFF